MRPLACSSADSPVRIHLSRLLCLLGHYGKILELADVAGTIEWSPISLEESYYKIVAEKLQTIYYKLVANKLPMTSFAVRKDEDRDRMISWPRTQNDLMPAPPGLELPDPSIFERLWES